jgi:AhpD family alkylhydroperoxidase
VGLPGSVGMRGSPTRVRRDVRPYPQGYQPGLARRMGHYAELIEDLKEPTRSLNQASRDVWSGFGQLHKAAVSEGALPAKVKELMALSIAVVKQCDGCIAYHAKAAGRRGATSEEVAEALGVALLMDGGTASVYGPRAWEAFHELTR